MVLEDTDNDESMAGHAAESGRGDRALDGQGVPAKANAARDGEPHHSRNIVGASKTLRGRETRRTDVAMSHESSEVRERPRQRFTADALPRPEATANRHRW
jgi:hypothetical protein